MNQQVLATDLLIDLLTRHQLIEAEELWRYLAEQGGAAGLPGDGAAAVADMVRQGLLTAYQGDQVLAGNVAGLHVGRYLLLDRLGGRDSTVFLAERRPDGARVALKLLPAELSRQSAFAERFRREAETLARLEHPGIVTIKDSGSDSGRLFLVTEHVEGTSLAELVERQGPLAPPAAVRIIHDAIRVIEHMHLEGGLLHGNLQPAHLMVDDKGKIRVLGLGLARPMEGPASCVRLGEGAASSADFQAPEQQAGPGAIDRRVDVYGLGATLHFLLTGRAPSGSVALRPDLPVELVDILERMLAADPTERYATPGEAGRDLLTWLHEASRPRALAPTPAPTVPLEITFDSSAEMPRPPAVRPAPADEGQQAAWLTALVALALGLAVFAIMLAVWTVL